MNWFFVIKVLVSAVIIAGVSEISKRSTFLGGVLASLPLVSLLSFIWIYVESRSTEKIASLSWSIFWLVIPSLALFVALPLLLQKTRLPFPAALGLSVVIMLACYGAMVGALRVFGIRV